MKYVYKSVVFKELPEKISLCYSISGCQKYCKGCHSSELWEEKNEHFLLNEFILREHLEEYKGLINGIVFLGGEWHEKELGYFLDIAKEYNLTTCLYSSEENISLFLKNKLDYVKLGKYNEKLGGLESPKTNQVFMEVKTNKILNKLFQGV